MQTLDGPSKRVLREVVGRVDPAERRTKPPDVGLGEAHKSIERAVIAASSRNGKLCELVHPGSLAGAACAGRSARPSAPGVNACLCGGVWRRMRPMLLSISTPRPPGGGDARDLGHLLHKHPDRAQSFPLGFGAAYVVYPEATAERCTAVLLVDVDAEALARQQRRAAAARAARTGFALAGSINDRAFAASSLLAVAMSTVFSTAMSGRCDRRPELVVSPLAIDVHLPVVSSRGGPELVERIFSPLGFDVEVSPIGLDPAFPEWGPSRFVDLRLRTESVLADVLTQLYVLLPVLDDDKHYWVEQSEVDKLLRRGERWLADHPERALITRRFLRHQPRLTREALDRLVVADGPLVDADAAEAAGDAAEQEIEKPLSLNEQRIEAVVEALVRAGAHTVADVGCGEGRLIARLLATPQFERILGIDVSMRSLRRAADRLHLDTMSPRQRGRVDLLQGSFLYDDDRLGHLDAVAAVEVIEHVDPGRLDAFARAVFGHASPSTVVVTTPNREHNVRFIGMPPGALRHRDHRFEWTREEFGNWVDHVGERFGYRAAITGIGSPDADVGPPTLMVVFSR